MNNIVEVTIPQGKLVKSKSRLMHFYTFNKASCPFCGGSGYKCTCIEQDKPRTLQHDYEDSQYCNLE